MSKDLEVQYTIKEAQADLEKSVKGLNDFIDGFYSLWRHDGWRLLGYENWYDLCAKAYRYKIKDKITRLEVVEALTNRGVSTPAIAAAVGYGQSTIARDVKDLTQMGRVAPDRVTIGLNDREYPQDQERAAQVVELVQDHGPKQLPSEDSFRRSRAFRYGRPARCCIRGYGSPATEGRLARHEG